jgi:hypothetical protein
MRDGDASPADRHPTHPAKRSIRAASALGPPVPSEPTHFLAFPSGDECRSPRGFGSVTPGLNFSLDTWKSPGVAFVARCLTR